VKIAADVRSSDFSGRVIKSGESVEPKKSAQTARGKAGIAAAKAAPERPVVAAVVGGAGVRGKRMVAEA
jgi:hypothetical protein